MSWKIRQNNRTEMKRCKFGFTLITHANDEKLFLLPRFNFLHLFDWHVKNEEQKLNPTSRIITAIIIKYFEVSFSTIFSTKLCRVDTANCLEWINSKRTQTNWTRRETCVACDNTLSYCWAWSSLNLLVRVKFTFFALFSTFFSTMSLMSHFVEQFFFIFFWNEFVKSCAVFFSLLGKRMFFSYHSENRFLFGWQSEYNLKRVFN